MGKPGVLLSLASQYGANTLTTTLAVEQALGELAAGAEGAGHHAFTRLCTVRPTSSSGRSAISSSR